MVTASGLNVLPSMPCKRHQRQEHENDDDNAKYHRRTHFGCRLDNHLEL